MNETIWTKELFTEMLDALQAAEEAFESLPRSSVTTMAMRLINGAIVKAGIAIAKGLPSRDTAMTSEGSEQIWDERNSFMQERDALGAELRRIDERLLKASGHWLSRDAMIDAIEAENATLTERAALATELIGRIERLAHAEAKADGTLGDAGDRMYFRNAYNLQRKALYALAATSTAVEPQP